MTLWENIKQNWNIKKSDIKDLGINPNKQWDDVTVAELYRLADFLDVLGVDILAFSE